ncbi:geranylgeranyl transferase type I beta subunit, putative [Ricinus communis]|uniref:Geranylgeranyl transferase type-1 subunit beta n=1 Tax=Ricinus communis TaxID=3988 RepID=B9T226_RICCO|nr:geranylgeranyl transferase type I beta subunit, putative [Ricinus communis]|eukprot:XP_002532295.1 geranylgeranyl transferase type-1 subunit beta isoform X1 [Ricinus communis]
MGEPGMEWNLSSPSSSDGEEQPSPFQSSSFNREHHIAYLEMMYQMLPNYYQSQEINRLTLAYFTISGLHILNALDRVDKDAVASWVLSFQAHPEDKSQLNNGQFYGFQGSRSSQFPLACNGVSVHTLSHLASSYSALAILKIVGYNLSNLDSKSILTSMRNLQQPDGSFLPIHIGAETDLRFIYCAAAICFMLEDWSGMDKEQAKEYIVRCQSYDGGFGMVSGSESHGGGTFCAVASLRLMGFIDDDLLSKDEPPSIIDVPLLLEWCLKRQAADGGFQGRLNKPTDTCYAFWVGAVLRILGGYKFIDGKALRGFLITCQSKYGGFSKFPGELPDIYHSYYGYTAFSLLEEPGLNSLCVELGITDVAALGI